MRQVDIRYAWLLLTLMLVGCQAANPLAQAETSEQRAYAAYGTFVIFQEKAADLAEDPNIPRGAKLRIIAAEERARPVAESLLEAYIEFVAIKAEFQAGRISHGALVTATVSLNDWILRLTPRVNELVRNIKGATT